MNHLSTFSLEHVPIAEDDEYEFKSSQTSFGDLKKKLSSAVSAFANSGGGHFIVGLDKDGQADGGLPGMVGKQDLRDWADQIINQVEPPPRYEIKLLNDPNGRGTIKAGHYLLTVIIHGSESGPHMAYDKKYYIRAGAHTEPARHFILDAIWARRHFAKPRLAHVLRQKPNYRQTIQLGIVAITATPALDVEVTLSPIPEILKTSSGENYFPLKVPMINYDNPYYIDVSTTYKAEERFGKDVQLEVKYNDLANTSYSYNSKVDINKTIAPIEIGNDPIDRIVKSLESINKNLAKR